MYECFMCVCVCYVALLSLVGHVDCLKVGGYVLNVSCSVSIDCPPFLPLPACLPLCSSFLSVDTLDTLDTRDTLDALSFQPTHTHPIITPVRSRVHRETTNKQLRSTLLQGAGQYLVAVVACLDGGAR